MTRAIGEVGEYIPKPERVVKAPKRLNPYNEERRERLFEEGFGPHADFIWQQKCVVAETHPRLRTRCRGPIEAAHLSHRGMGGCKGTWRDLFPACTEHHVEHDKSSADFQARYELDLAVYVEVLILRDPWPSEEEKEAAEARLAKLREPR